MIHDLKILPEFYLPVACGSKTFEYRINDRHFKVGDTVYLHKWWKNRYIPAPVLKLEITYVFLIPDSVYCIFSFDLLNGVYS